MSGEPSEDFAGAGNRDRYVREFERIARASLAESFLDLSGRVESFGVEGERTVHAEVRLVFRGHRYSYRRQVWPTDHPLPLKAAMYVTFLEERLLTRRPPPDADPESHIAL